MSGGEVRGSAEQHGLDDWADMPLPSLDEVAAELEASRLTPADESSTSPGMEPEHEKEQQGAEPGELKLEGESFAETRLPLGEERWLAELIESGVSPMYAKAQVKHRRDLPALLEKYEGQ